MNDDWRLQIEFREDGFVDALEDRLDARELEDDLSDAFHDRVIVTRNETTVFLYAGERAQAESARKLIEAYAEREQEELGLDFRRWHPVAQDWQPADEPLPETAEARAAEHHARIAREREEVEEQGYPEYEVRVDLASHEQAEKLADRLRDEGLPTVHRWKFVLVGAVDEDHARELAEQVEAEAPAGSLVEVQGTWRDVRADALPNRFAFLGGLGG